VLRWTFKALGNEAAADEAAREFEAAKRSREAARRG
jgi:hypothetical protein